MYVKSSTGVFLMLAGITAPPATTPAMRVARILLEVTGAGFGLYCLAAFGLFLAGCWLRLYDRMRRRAPREGS